MKAAILNFILTLFIAFVLLQIFFLGNLKPQRRAQELFFPLTAPLQGSDEGDRSSPTTLDGYRLSPSPSQRAKGPFCLLGLLLAESHQETTAKILFFT